MQTKGSHGDMGKGVLKIQAFLHKTFQNPLTIVGYPMEVGNPMGLINPTGMGNPMRLENLGMDP